MLNSASVNKRHSGRLFARIAEEENPVKPQMKEYYSPKLMCSDNHKRYSEWMDYYNDQTPFVIYSVKNNTGANASEWAMVHKLESLTPQSPLEAAFEQFHKQEPQEEDVISEEGNLSIPYENTMSNQELW